MIRDIIAAPSGLRFQNYRNRKSDCVSVDPVEVVKIKIRWSYRTDIKAPVIGPAASWSPPIGCRAVPIILLVQVPPKCLSAKAEK